MINENEARIEAWTIISELFGNDYFRSHFEGSCESYPTNDDDDVIFDYFMGFESDNNNQWSVFARVSVNRETREVHFLDYKTPGGKRMDNPPNPIRLAKS